MSAEPLVAPEVAEPDSAPDRGWSHLLARLELLEARVRVAVERRRRADADPDDPVRGLYVSDDDVDRLLADGPWRAGLPPADASRLAAIEERADRREAAGAPTRLRHLQAAFGLDALDVELLLAALAPDLDQRFERLYSYLHDDITRPRASIGLAYELAGIRPTAPAGRQRLRADGRLVGHRLLVVGDRERPFLTRTLRVPDRVADWLLGDDEPDPNIAPLVRWPRPVPVPGRQRLARVLAEAGGCVFVRDRPGTAAAALAVAGADTAGYDPMLVDLTRPAAREDPVLAVVLAVREAGLAGAALVVDGLEVLTDRDPAGLGPLVDAPCPVVFVGAAAWEPSWTTDPPLQIAAPPLRADVRRVVWDGLMGEADFEPVEVMTQFQLSPEEARRTAAVAELRAVGDQRPVVPGDLRAAAREGNAGRLEDLARRITPEAGFQDLVLPDGAVARLVEITQRVRHRDRVLGEWEMGGRGIRGRGVTALFAGPSGTGKTLSAEVIAGELGLDLYTIDLSTVVDKYVGETEKNLERIFDEAEGVNGVLFFDEADALFGKRSAVTDARDRYANVEVAFLLQRMETFDGIAVLATNLRANLDEAFTRRIDVLIDFPTPDDEHRLRLWELHLPDPLPRSDELDLAYLASAFDLTGGDIRNITVAGGYAAAQDGTPLTMAHLIRATAREYRKLGRLCTESEFGPYMNLIEDPPEEVERGQR